MSGRDGAEPGAGVVAVAGEVIVDLVPVEPDGPYEAVPGGSPANVAVGLGRLGVPTRMLARLADDPLGRRLRAHLADNSVDLSHAVHAGEPASLAVVELGANGVAEYDFRVEGTADWQWTDAELATALNAAAPDAVVALHSGSLALVTPPGDRHPRHQRCGERPGHVRPGAAQHDHSDRHQDERERHADVDHLLQLLGRERAATATTVVARTQWPHSRRVAYRRRDEPMAAEHACRVPARRPRSAPSGHRMNTARRELLLCAVVGVVVGVPVGFVTTTVLMGVLVGWDAATAVYLVWLWTLIWPSDADTTARHATVNDPNRALTDVILLTAAVASLVAVAFVLTQASSTNGAAQVLLVVLGVTSVVLAWGMVHSVYTLRYARLYYGATVGGVNFNDTTAPDYTDFAYLAFTVGMTYQVSDTSLQSNEFRRAALRHALLSFLFGTGIVATSINLVASLISH